MKGEKRMIESEEGGLDQFRKLPDEILALILSNLPSGEAIVTSMLSRRWRYQWKNISILNFKVVEEEHVSTKKTIIISEDFLVNNFLVHLVHPTVKTCLITHYGNTNNQLEYTLGFLLNKFKTEELVIKFNPSPDSRVFYRGDSCELAPVFSDGIFGCENHLLKIQLENYYYVNKVEQQQQFFSFCVNLVTLKLRRLTCTLLTYVGEIIKGCDLLENLVIEDSVSLPLIIGNNTRIKTLEINRCSLSDFDIHIDSLRFLSLSNSTKFSWYSCKIQCLNLCVLQIHCGSVSCRFPIPTCSLLNMYSGNGVLHFPNLKVLRTTMDLNKVRHNLKLRDLFRHCTKLQEVDIFNEVDKDDNTSDFIPQETSMWSREFCESIVYGLRLFRIKSFNGQERELRLVDYLITNATKLKKLVIQFDKITSQGEEGIICNLKQQVIKKEVLSLVTRSYSNVSVIFDTFSHDVPLNDTDVSLRMLKLKEMCEGIKLIISQDDDMMSGPNDSLAECLQAYFF